MPWRKVLPALFLMCDESWALGLTDARERGARSSAPRLSLPFYLSLALALYLTWVVFTAVGSVVGPLLGDVERYGFGMAFPAVFLVLLRGMWPGWRAARPWLVSLVVAAGTYLLVPGAWYVVAGALAGVISAYAWAGER